MNATFSGKTDVGLLGNKIKKIGKIELNSSKVYDATDKVVLPGIIDTQVHFREPGSTDAVSYTHLTLPTKA